MSTGLTARLVTDWWLTTGYHPGNAHWRPAVGRMRLLVSEISCCGVLATRNQEKKSWEAAAVLIAGPALPLPCRFGGNDTGLASDPLLESEI